jgi:hypothetical protein
MICSGCGNKLTRAGTFYVVVAGQRKAVCERCHETWDRLTNLDDDEPMAAALGVTSDSTSGCMNEVK